MIFTNVSPLGELELAHHGVIEAGARFTVKPEHLAGIVGQVENFEPDDDEARAARDAYLNPPTEPAGDHDSQNEEVV